MWISNQLIDGLIPLALLLCFTAITKASEVEVYINQKNGLCLKPPTSSVAQSQSGRFYQWEDRQGNRVYSDRPQQAGEQATNYSYTQKAYFEPEFTALGGDFPAQLRLELTQDVNQVFRSLGRWLGEDRLRRVFLKILLVHEQNDYRNMASAVSASLSNSRGFYSYTNNQVVVLNQDDRIQMQALLRHESTHVILAGLVGQTQPWFSEGLAEYFEAGSEYRSLLHRGLKDLGGYIPLNRLMLLRGGFYAGNVNVHYLQSGSLIDYLSSNPNGQKVLKAYLRFLAEQPCRDHQSHEFFDQQYPGGIAALEQDWLSYASSY